MGFDPGCAGTPLLFGINSTGRKHYLVMKYLIIILCLGLVGCGSMGHGGRSKKKGSEERVAIQKVMEARSDIRQVISHAPQTEAELAAANHDPSVLVFSVDDYVKRLRAIPLTGCPEEFKTAFVNYAEAWNDRAAANPGLCLPLAGGNGTHTENDPEAAELTESTWHALQDTATKYLTKGPSGD